MPSYEGIKHVLLDIEGTICPISFVKETLFPYAIRALPEVLISKWDDEGFKPYREAFPDDVQESPDTLQAHVEDLTKRDVKIAYLKSLQGYLWEDGYKSGAYSTPLFEDVAPQLRNWRDAGLDLAIYSSGSIFAQKLLFGHVRREQSGNESEDLRELIHAWFDTTNAGPKTDKTSYQRIADEKEWQPSEVLFLSDNVHEVDAALASGMRSVVVERPGNAPLSNKERSKHDISTTLNALVLNPVLVTHEGNTTQPPVGDAVDAEPNDVAEKRKSTPSKKRKTDTEQADPAKAVRRSTRLSSTSEAA